MAPNSSTVAVEVAEHHITIHWKSDNQVRRIYVHPDNVVLTSSTAEWSNRRGGEYTLYQNKYEARVSIERLCHALKEDRASWATLSVDQVMASIKQQIGMEATLWTKISRWVNAAVTRLFKFVAKAAIGFHTGGLIGWL